MVLATCTLNRFKIYNFCIHFYIILLIITINILLKSFDKNCRLNQFWGSSNIPDEQYEEKDSLFRSSSVELYRVQTIDSLYSEAHGFSFFLSFSLTIPSIPAVEAAYLLRMQYRPVHWLADTGWFSFRSGTTPSFNDTERVDETFSYVRSYF